MPPEGAATMLTLHSILDEVREFWLRCIGSPHSRGRQLAALRKLDAHLLRDIGLTPEDVRDATTARPGSPIWLLRPRPVSRGRKSSLNT
jgi:uncharacterized protein YjiS (DUF1127 family)